MRKINKRRLLVLAAILVVGLISLAVFVSAAAHRTVSNNPNPQPSAPKKAVAPTQRPEGIYILDAKQADYYKLKQGDAIYVLNGKIDAVYSNGKWSPGESIYSSTTLDSTDIEFLPSKPADSSQLDSAKVLYVSQRAITGKTQTTYEPPAESSPQPAPAAATTTPKASLTSDPVFRVNVGETKQKDGRRDCFTNEKGEKQCYLVATDGTYYIQDLKDKSKYTPTNAKAYNDSINKALESVCTGSGEEQEKCREEKLAQMQTHEDFAAFIAEQRKFTFQEGIELGSNLWALGTKFKIWSEADNPMSQLNEFFTNSKTGLWLSGNWEKSICWETTDFNRPTDGVAFVPGTENVGAWVAGEYVEYTHPVLSNPSATTTEYIYRITSFVNPTGLTTHSGSANCMDIMQFQYTLDRYAIDLDMDGKTSDDVIKIACDSKPYSLTEQNSLVRVSDRIYGTVCIAFQPMFLKSAFYSSLDAGRLCAPIVPAGYEYGTACQWCPGVFTAQTGMAGVGYGSGGAWYAGTPQENRPGVNNPASASG